jgi:SAM-dependent methyltransferase
MTPRGNADVWICDATALPFADGTFAFAVGMNVLDCLGSPRDGLVEFDRVLVAGGQIVLSVPFDWTGSVTPVEHWIGGHSQRGPLNGDASEVLDLLLTDGPLAAGGLRRKSPAIEIPWHVRLHERSCMHYYAYGLAAISG